MKIIFFGTANISRFFLENIDKKHEIVSVVTMCDKPVGRANKIKAPAVKEYAIEKNISYIQVDKFNDEIVQQIKDYNADHSVKLFLKKFLHCLNMVVLIFTFLCYLNTGEHLRFNKL